MLDTIKCILGLRKEILLSVLDTFPHWHSRYGERTGFAEKINGNIPGKIHALKSGIIFWEEASRKLATGRYIVRIVYMEDTHKGKVYYPITRCRSLHVQRAYFDLGTERILIEEKPVDIIIVAQNEGLSRDDFIQFLYKYAGREFAIVHFTEFRY